VTWQRAWMVLAALLLISAAFFLWRNNLPGAFVTAALGSCAWFLSYRAQIRASGDQESEHSSDEEINKD